MSKSWDVTDNMVLLTMIIGSFLVVTLCLLFVVVVHCFNKREVQVFRKIKRRYKIRRSLQTTFNIAKEESGFYTNRDEWDRIDIPIDAREKSLRYQREFPRIPKAAEGLSPGIERSFINPDYNRCNSYSSFLSSDQWTEV